MATRLETAIKNRHYNQLLGKLNASLHDMRYRCSSLSNCDLTDQHPKDILAQLEVLRFDVSAQRHDVEDLVESGQELMSILEELDCIDTPKAREILQNQQEIQKSFADLSKLVEDKCEHFKILIAKYEAAELELNSLLAWVRERQAVLKLSEQSSLDLSVLREQVVTHCNLLSDVLTHEHHVTLVTERCRSLGIRANVSELLETFHELSSQVKARDQKLQNILEKLSGIKSDSERIAKWISVASQQLERKKKKVPTATLR